MKARTLVPALALAAALLAPAFVEARDGHRPPRGRPPAHGYYGHRQGYGYRSHGYRPYYGGYRYYAPPAYYGYGYGHPYGFTPYGYGYYLSPPPPRYYPPRPRFGIWLGF